MLEVLIAKLQGKISEVLITDLQRRFQEYSLLKFNRRHQECSLLRPMRDIISFYVEDPTSAKGAILASGEAKCPTGADII